MYDRSYYRALPEKRLVELASESGHELAIALGEALDAALAALDGADALEAKRLKWHENEIEDLRAALADNDVENSNLAAELEEAYARIKELEGRN